MVYDPWAAVAYARRWALGRNPAWAALDEMGGDCANFVSQCLFAGCGVMNFTPVTGWFYISLDRRAPAWTGVEELRRFLMNNRGPGPYGQEAPLTRAAVGDVVFLDLGKGRFSHGALVTQGAPSVLVAAHTRDRLDEPLQVYPYRRLSLLKILGVTPETPAATNERILMGF